MPSPRLLSGLAACLSLATAVAVHNIAVSDAASAPRSAAPGHDRLVREDPGAVTPAIADGRVYAIAALGDTVVVGGSFTRVSSYGGYPPVTRRYLFAFDRTTGRVDPWFVPRVDGEVRTLLAGPTAGTVYVGGRFRTVGGTPRRGLVLLSLDSGAPVARFAPRVDGPVYDLAMHPTGRLLVGGTFSRVAGEVRRGLASVDPRSGTLGDYLAVRLAGHHNWDGDGAKAAVGARRFALSPDGSRLVVIGNFRTADGWARDQIAVLTTSSRTSSVSSWHTGAFEPACAAHRFDTWVRDVAYSPDGSYFVVVTSGGGYPGTLCDTASRWSGTVAGAGQTPEWVAASGGDTLLSTTVTEQAVYVGGHIRRLNNPAGRNAAGPGSVGRASIAALDPVTGLPLSWNPGRNPRGYGVTELSATPRGLWLGYDTAYLGNFRYRRERIGFFPLAGGATVPSRRTAGLPGRVYLGAEGGVTANLRVRDYAGPGEVTESRRLDSSGDTDWREVRGAFWVGGTLFYGMSDGRLYRREFDGSGWGTPEPVDPYHDNDGVRPDWDGVSDGTGGTYAGALPDFYGAELASVTGMCFAAGRLYYTRAESDSLQWRWFTPSSGVVGARRFTAARSGFGDVAGGLFVSDDHLYVSRTDGNLYRMPFAGGVPSGSPEVVSGPGVDGHAWRARAIFPGP